MTVFPPPPELPVVTVKSRQSRAVVVGLSIGLGFSVLANLFLVGALLSAGESTGPEAQDATSLEEPEPLQEEDVAPIPAPSNPEKLSASEIYEQAGPSVFTIRCMGFGGEFFEGTGFAYSPANSREQAPFLVTNYHVIETCFNFDTDIAILTASGQEFPASIEGVDPPNDLALLAANVPLQPLLPARQAQIGDTVFAIGSPLGTRGTITQGIISNIEGEVYQIDARIFQGNSGGPLINEQGDVIGVNTQKIFEQGTSPRAEGIGFSYQIQLLCEQLISCR